MVRRATPRSPQVEAGLAAEVPLLAAAALAPLVAGTPDPLPPLALSVLVWLSLLLRLAIPGLPPLLRPRGWGLAVAFTALAGLSLVVSVNRGATLVQTALYASGVAALVLAADLARRGRAGRLLTALLAGALVAAGLGVREYGEHVRAGEPNWRAFSRFTNPNFFAGYVAPALLLALGAALRRPPAFRTGTWLFSMALLVGTLAAALGVSASRGGLLAFAAGLVVLAILVPTTRLLRDPEVRLRAAALAGLVALVLALASAPVRSRQAGKALGIVPQELCPRRAAGYTEDSNRFRLYTWRAALRMARERPLLGWGAGTFDSAVNPHLIAGYTRHAHEGYLQLLAEGGVAAPLLWLALLGAAAFGIRSALRATRPSSAALDSASALGAAGALAATAAHNLLDSILFVPASLLFSWLLLGLALGGSAPGETDRAAAPSSGSKGDAARRRALVLAAVGLAVTGALTAGRTLLALAERQAEQDPWGALERLRLAERLLPWDHQVAVLQCQVYRHPSLGQWTDAIDAAQRAVALAPYRPPGYLTLAVLRQFQGDLNLALATLRVGLEHAPNEVRLLHACAQVLERLGLYRDAEETYRRIVAVEESPAGQVRAVGELREYRFALARLALARAAERAGRREEALEQRKAAACLLAERRALFDGNPAPYLAEAARDPQSERDLRTEEAALWEWLSREFRRRGETRLAALAGEQLEATRRSRGRLEALLDELAGRPLH